MPVKKRGVGRPKKEKPVLTEVKVKPLTKSEKYLSLLQTPGMTKKEARDLAGFSPKSGTSSIDRLPSVRKGLASLEKQREYLSQKADYSFTGVAERFVKRAKSKAVSDRVQTDNDKALCGIMGFNAPATVNVKSVGLIMELSDVNKSDLEALKECFGG